jgi:hypothetical protein
MRVATFRSLIGAEVTFISMKEYEQLLSTSATPTVVISHDRIVVVPTEVKASPPMVPVVLVPVSLQVPSEEVPVVDTVVMVPVVPPVVPLQVPSVGPSHVRHFSTRLTSEEVEQKLTINLHFHRGTKGYFRLEEPVRYDLFRRLVLGEDTIILSEEEFTY